METGTTHRKTKRQSRTTSRPQGVNPPSEHHRESGDTQRLRLLLETMAEAYFETDLDGRLTFCNHALCKLLGRPYQELAQTRIAAHLTPESTTLLQAALQEVLATAQSCPRMALTLLSKEEAQIDAQSAFHLLRDPSGNPAGFGGVMLDVTGNNAMQKALQESEDKYQNILESAPYSISVFKASDGSYVQVSKGFCEYTGFKVEEVIGRTAKELNLHLSEEDERSVITALQRDRKIDRLEMPFQTKDGRVIDVIMSARPIRFNGQACYLSIATDVTPIKEAQKALAQSEESYRTILDTAPYAITISRIADEKYIHVNDAFCERTGYSREEVIGHTTTELNLYIDKKDRQRMFESLRAKGRVDGMEISYRLKDGTTTDALMSARAIYFKGELCLLFISTNITDLKNVQRALAESEESYRAILETAPYSITVTRISDLTYVQVNRSFCQRTGYSKDEVVGRNAMDLGLYVDPNDREQFLESYRHNGRVDGMEMRFKTKDGRVIESLLSARPIRFKNDECLLVISADVTAQKEIQRALSEREQKYRNILSNMEEGYWETDLRGTLTFANEAEARIHRCSIQELTGKNNRSFSKPETYTKIYQIFNQVYRTGAPAKVFDYELQREDGSWAVIELSASLRRDESGKPIGFFGISRDVTEKKRTERELEKYRQHLEEMVLERTQALEAAQKELVKREKLAVLGQLTATVSHELRNPLGVIRSSNFYLQRRVENKDEKVNKHFKRIEEQVAQCDAIVADLLEYTRGRTASMVLADMRPWINDIINQFNELEPIPILRDLSGTLPLVSHDPEKMRRVLINLLDNAFLAIKDKQGNHNGNVPAAFSPLVKVMAYHGNGHVVMEVQDNGVGMNEETRQRAFEPLYTTRARGTGIGLANVHKIVTEHHGSILLISEPGQGTTVRIQLPCPAERR
jgi:PAS domain S-box-containing protein